MFKAHDSNNGSGILSLVGGQAPDKHLVSGGIDKKVVLWDLRMSAQENEFNAITNAARLATWHGHKDPVQSILIQGSSILSFAGSRIGICSSSGALDQDKQVLNPVRIRGLKGNKERAYITSAALLPCSRCIVCGTDEGFLRIIK